MSNGPKVTAPAQAAWDFIQRQNADNNLRNAFATQGYLRAEVVLGSQSGIDLFPVLDQQTVAGQQQAPTERRLITNDGFWMTHLAVMFYTFETGETIQESFANRARARLQSFANDQVFGLNAPEVEGAFNGRLKLTVDSVVWIESLDMNAFKFAEQAQQGLAVSDVVTTGVMSQNTWRQDEAFKRIMAPMIYLNGQSNVQFRVTFPDTLDFGLVDGSQVAAVLYLRGWHNANGGMARVAQR